MYIIIYNGRLSACMRVSVICTVVLNLTPGFSDRRQAVKMHNEERTDWWKEGLITLVPGACFGVTSVVIGHPFDTVKTRMQAMKGFEGRTMIRSFIRTVHDQGIPGLYRGALFPLLGSSIYRSVQFATYEAIYTYMDSPIGKYQLPGTFGLESRVIFGGLAGGTARALIETPLEYAKIRRQTLQSWKVKDMYKGFGVTWSRSVGMLSTFFILYDSTKRFFPDMLSKPLLGPFLMGGVAATLAWWVVWPVEYMKSQVQAGYGTTIPVYKRMMMIVKQRGFFALYRGFIPGTMRSFAGNGIGMIVLLTLQRKMTELGLR